MANNKLAEKKLSEFTEVYKREEKKLNKKIVAIESAIGGLAIAGLVAYGVYSAKHKK